MQKHWNVQVHVQEITPEHEAKNPNGYMEKGIGGAPIVIERRVKDTLTIAVAADTEDEAYRKAIALLEINRPELTEVRDLVDRSQTTRPK